jgi:hypothetical protein
MSWTIACFCGNVYTAPPDRCDACGSALDHAATRPTASATDVPALAARAVIDADCRPLTAYRLHASGQRAATFGCAVESSGTATKERALARVEAPVSV